jgi:dienelactone hydrolase
MSGSAQRKPQTSPRRRTWRTVAWAVLAVVVLASAGFVLWASAASQPMPEALAALQPDDKVQVETGANLVFKPKGAAPVTGLVFYPGGKVDYRAYAPVAHALAAEGYLVVIPRMPLNLAVLAPNKATAIEAAYPEIKAWAIGGHSLGGAMAARYVYQHPDKAKGLVLWAAYPAASDSMADRMDLAVVSISGSNDGLATPAKIGDSAALLPPQTRWKRIDGGNHAQFGYYGPQSGDNPARIDREDQQTQALSETKGLLERLSK